MTCLNCLILFSVESLRCNNTDPLKTMQPLCFMWSWTLTKHKLIDWFWRISFIHITHIVLRLCVLFWGNGMFQILRSPAELNVVVSMYTWCSKYWFLNILYYVPCMHSCIKLCWSYTLSHICQCWIMFETECRFYSNKSHLIPW